jgi:hypothetical protein
MFPNASDRDHGSASPDSDGRLRHEPGLVDPKPRERRWTLATGGLWVLGVVAGAALFALCLWISALVFDQHYSVLAYLIVAGIGAGALPGLLPYIAVARADGEDAEIVKRRTGRGTADAPVDGAEAVDTGRVREDR